jgi:hypothetical protein
LQTIRKSVISENRTFTSRDPRIGAENIIRRRPGGNKDLPVPVNAGFFAVESRGKATAGNPTRKPEKVMRNPEADWRTAMQDETNFEGFGRIEPWALCAM